MYKLLLLTYTYLTNKYAKLCVYVKLFPYVRWNEINEKIKKEK